MKILLVENDEDDRTLFIEAIEILDQNIVVDAVSNGFEALQYLDDRQQSNCLPEVIFVDVSIPRMNAFKLARAIREIHNYDNIPLVILTTLNSYKESLMCRQLESPYLVKPYAVGDFAKAIAESLEIVTKGQIKTIRR
jgi:CheY-like chemotaxis protein